MLSAVTKNPIGIQIPRFTVYYSIINNIFYFTDQ